MPLLLTTCDLPPEGLTVRGDEAHAYGFVVVRSVYDGYRSDPEPLPPKEEACLWEQGFTYAGFEPDASETGRILLGSYEPVGEGAPVAGRLLYARARSGER